MLPEFFTTAELLDWRSWRPEQPSQLLGVPDAVLMIRDEEPVLAFLRWRVEAAETTVGFRAHEDRPEKMGPSWNTFEYVLYDALGAAVPVHDLAFRVDTNNGVGRLLQYLGQVPLASFDFLLHAAHFSVGKKDHEERDEYTCAEIPRYVEPRVHG